MTAMTAMTGWHFAILLLGAIGFGALALASERQGEQLLGRLPTPRRRTLYRVIGWALLALALAICVLLWGGGVGATYFFGWLTIAGAALVFAIPHWSPEAKQRERPARRTPAAGAGRAPAEIARPALRPQRVAAALMLGLMLVVFVVALIKAQAGPLDRATAIHGQVGPWPLVLAEADAEGPEIVDMGVPLKAFRLRFCEACDGEIRFAYLKVNRPRSLRAAGLAFEGARWERRVEIQMPATLGADSDLWLTVVGKDGSVHQASWPMQQVAPATVAWFDNRLETGVDQ